MNINIFFSTKLFFVLFIGIGITFNSWAQRPTCPRTVGAELVTNGDFSLGNTNFTSGYTYSASTVNPGQYSIGTNPSLLNPAFANISDHSPSADNRMLIMDVDATVGKNVYTTQVNVVAGRTYFFSAWFANINTNTTCGTCSVNPPKYENAPQLRFAIEGITVGTIVRVDSTNHGWTQFNTSWTALTTGSIDISIQNLRNVPNGNDLALDDISFKAGCDGITDLSKLGKSSVLRDTIFSCNENFAFNLNTQLTNSKYALNWYQGTSLQGTAGIVMNDQRDPTSSSVFSVGAAPPNGTKYYVCYDSLGDGVTCARLDSVVFLSQFNFDIPDQKVCPPVSVVLDPSLTTTNITSWTYERTLPAPITPVANGTGFVQPQTVTKAGTYRLTIQHANGTCSSTPDLVKIDTLVAAFNGAINASCTSGTPSGNVTLVPNTSGAQSVTVVGGNVKVSWYTTITGGTAVASGTGATGVTTTAGSNLIVTPNCSTGGLYLQDDNSYAATVPLANCAGALSEINSAPNAVFQKITVAAPTSISSINVFTKSNNGNGENLTINLDLFAFPIANFNALGAPIATIATRNLPAFTSTTLASVTVPGNNYVIQPGTYYIRVMSFETATPSNVRSVGVQKNCRGAASNYQDNGATPVINFDPEFREYGNATAGVHGPLFNANFQVGNPTSCGRVWVCATCTTPVTYTYFNLFPTSDSNVMLTWGTAQETNNQKFVIEFSPDGVNFSSVGEVLGNDNSRIKKDYSFIHTDVSNKQYYRIKQIDHDGKFAYTPVKYVTLTGNDWIQSVYPQPVKQGESLNIQVNSLHDDHVSIKVTDIEGHTVLHNDLDVVEGGDHITLNTSSMRPGVYILSLSTVESVKMVKIVIE